MIATSRQQRRALLRANKQWPESLREIPRDQWPNDDLARRSRVWRSSEFLVQQFDEPNGVTRLSINRTVLLATGRWDENITWDELQRIKRECGYGDHFAVEVFPADYDVVNVANMRHLWLLPAPLSFAWSRSSR